MAEKEKKIVVGFWYRLLADVIDAILLGIFGFLLSFPLKSFFYGLGENGLYLGLIITFLYTGILQSHIGEGQSIAKRILKIQVLNLDGSYQSLPKSFFRYSIIALIFYSSWIYMALSSIFPFLNNKVLQSAFMFFIVFLFLGVTILVVFHPLKRGIHDLIAQSIVVRKGLFDSQKIEYLNQESKVKRAFMAWGSCCVILVAFSGYMLLINKEYMPLITGLLSIQKNIRENTGLKNITADHTWYFSKNAEGMQTKTTSVNVFGFIEKSKFDNEELRMAEIEKSAKIVAASYSKIQECDYINVQVRTGFNIGISSVYYNETKSFNKDGELLKYKEDG